MLVVCKMLLHDGMSRFETGSNKPQPKVPEPMFIPFQRASSERDRWFSHLFPCIILLCLPSDVKIKQYIKMNGKKNYS